MSFSYKQKVALWDWYEIESVGSTNDAIKEFQDKLPVAITAINQTGGRGRFNRKWLSIKGNLYLTFSLDIPPQDLSRYVCLIGLSLHKTIANLNPRGQVKVKWPNDIYLEDKKLTGMLLENIKGNQWAVGVGVNISGSPQILDQPYQATSLAEHGVDIDRTDFLSLFLNNLATDIAIYKEQGFSSIKQQWLNNAWHLGQEITIKNHKETKKGIFLTLDDNGYLILKRENKKERIIAGDLFI